MKPWSLRELLSYLGRIEGATTELDHFSLLDVSTTASDDDIQRAFHRVAGGIHPDRHRKALTDEQRERLTIVYARIAEAYRVLRDPSEREAYLLALHRKEQTSDPPAPPSEKSEVSVLSPKAQRHFQRAKSALQTGDRTSAILNLKMALRVHPTSDLLRGALARIEDK